MSVAPSDGSGGGRKDGRWAARALPRPLGVRAPGRPLALTGHVHTGSRAGAQHRRRSGVESSPVPKNRLEPRKCGGTGAGPTEEARRAFETHLSVVRGVQGRPVRPQHEHQGRAAAGGQAGRRLGRAGSRRGAGSALGALGALGDTEDRSWRQLVPGAGSASCLLARDAREEGSSTVTERHEGRVGPP